MSEEKAKQYRYFVSYAHGGRGDRIRLQRVNASPRMNRGDFWLRPHPTHYPEGR